jgi:hypothetical protein
VNQQEQAISKSERDDLARVIRLRAKVAREAVAQRESEQLAGVEEQLAARYRADHKLWADITAEAEDAVNKADAQIAKICREHGIPEEFRPSLHLNWYGRGENAEKDRRAELRKVAQARIAATGKAAKTAIGAKEADLLTAVIRGGLTSNEARALLESLPSVEQLMPPIALHELESAGQLDSPTLVRGLPAAAASV